MKRLRMILILTIIGLASILMYSCSNNDNVKEEDYTIIFNLMGGSYNDSNESVIVKASYNEVVNPIIPMREGFIFDGWCSTLDETMNNDMDFDIPINKSKVVYAVWHRLTIEYELNGGFFTKYSTIQELRRDFMSDYQTIYPIDASSFFWGSSGTMESFLENNTFYVKWRPLFEYIRSVCNSYKAIREIEYLFNNIASEDDFVNVRLQLHAFLNNTKLHYNDGKVDDTPDYSKLSILNKVWPYYKKAAQTFFDNSKDYTLPNPRLENKTFLGWYDNPECNGERITFIPAGTMENKKYYALWQ